MTNIYNRAFLIMSFFFITRIVTSTKFSTISPIVPYKDWSNELIFLYINNAESTADQTDKEISTRFFGNSVMTAKVSAKQIISMNIKNIENLLGTITCLWKPCKIKLRNSFPKAKKRKN